MGDQGSRTVLPLSAARPIERAESDFAGAELTLVYDRATGDGASSRRLVFGVVELLHDGLEFGPQQPERHGDGCSRFDNHELNVRRLRLSVRDAIEWYRACASGKGVIPPMAHERSANPEGFVLDLPALGEEPPWPTLALDEKDEYWDGARFWGARPGGTRRHQLVSEDPEFAFGGWPEGLRRKAREWLRSQLAIDLFERPRLLGSIHLVLTNPVFGQVMLRLNGEDRRQVFVSIQTWPGKPLPGLTARVREERAIGRAVDEAVALNGRHVTLQFPHEPHLLNLLIESDGHGPLFASGTRVFIRQISTSIGIVGTRRSVSVPGRSRARGPEVYTVDVATSTETVTVGDRALPSALATLLREEAELQGRRDAQKLGQHWFQGETDEATSFVRNLIGGVRQDALIIDPYFGYTELLRFACASRTSGTTVRILTSNEHLGRAPGVGALSAAGMLRKAVAEVVAKDRTMALQVRVAPGAKAPIHDRFVVADQRDVWLLGSSLNEFGTRGTTAVRLPYGAAVRVALEACWGTSPGLDEWIAQASAGK